MSGEIDESGEPESLERHLLIRSDVDGDVVEDNVRSWSILPRNGAMNGMSQLPSIGQNLNSIEGVDKEKIDNEMITRSQIAIIGAHISPIESLDYETVENAIFKQSWRSRSKAQIAEYVALKWTFALLIGLFTGLAGFFNNFSVENISGYKMLWTSSLLLNDRYFSAFLLLAGCNLALAGAAAILCAYVAPAAAGSGIPEVKAYLNGIDSNSILAPSTLFVKIFGSIGGVSSGLVLGKEGPMVHTGACIASFLGQGGSRKFGLTWRGFKYFKNDRDRRDLITCGAAAGVAAAFRAPVGGVLFALEEAATWWRSTLLWRTFFTTAIVAVVLRNLIGHCQKGGCGLFGGAGFVIFDVSKNDSTVYNRYDLLAILVIGVIGGIFGALYNFLMDKILRFYSIFNERGPPYKIFLTLFISLVTSCCAYGLPWLSKCTPCPERIGVKCPTIETAGNYKKFNCPVGHYNDLATLFFNTNDGAIRNLFNGSTEHQFSQTTLSIHFATIYVLGLVTYGVAVPSGLFIPVILAGASYGRFIGNMLDSFSAMDHGIFALLGSAAFLGGTMRMTVSVCIIILELTNDLLMLPLIMLVLLVSKTVADCFTRGVYDQIVVMKGLPFMESHAESYMKGLAAKDVIRGPIVAFTGVEKVRNIFTDLWMTQHNGFPVVDSGGHLRGLITRDHLLVLLDGKNFTEEEVPTGADALLRRFDPFDFAKGGSGKGIRLEDLKIDEEDMEKYVDLYPIMNTSPYTVVESMSLAKAKTLFRELGLRHLCVVPTSSEGPPIVGILTRHDFMEQHILQLHPNLDAHK